MTKIPFCVSYRPQIESGEYKVVTREDRPVEIIKWDLKGDFPIVGVYYDAKNNRETAVQVTAEGRCSVISGEEYCDDFFIITDKPELTEFEGELKTIINTFSSCGDFMGDKSARNFGKILLDAARKEIEKDMPKWKKVAEVHSFDEGISIRNTPDGDVLVLNTDGNKYFLNINELLKLPKEK